MSEPERNFQIFAKPMGPVCNLSCDYCYYLEKKKDFPRDEHFRMPEEILERYVIQYIQATSGSTAHFVWHGGEPTLLGLDYFRKIVELQQKHVGKDNNVTNNIQTNGVNIDEQWCRFLSKEGFSVGLSLDGPREMHDVYRRTNDGKSTHEMVLRGYDLLRQYRVPVDILCVVHAANVVSPREVYGFFRSIEARYLGFIPLVEPVDGGRVSVRSVSATAWGSFLCSIYDEWKQRDIGRMKIQIIEEVARAALGHDHMLCVFRKTCGDVPVVEHNGDFFSCDHFVHADHLVGNITESPLVELLDSRKQKIFGNAKSALPKYCHDCAVLRMCYGGCPKDRIIETPDGEPGLNYLCEGYKSFFMHCSRFVEELANQAATLAGGSESSAPPTLKHKVSGKIGRNEPCPCGSGKKYKNCCLSN